MGGGPPAEVDGPVGPLRRGGRQERRIAWDAAEADGDVAPVLAVDEDHGDGFRAGERQELPASRRQGERVGLAREGTVDDDGARPPGGPGVRERELEAAALLAAR